MLSHAAGQCKSFLILLLDAILFDRVDLKGLIIQKVEFLSHQRAKKLGRVKYLLIVNRWYLVSQNQLIVFDNFFYIKKLLTVFLQFFFFLLFLVTLDHSSHLSWFRIFDLFFFEIEEACFITLSSLCSLNFVRILGSTLFMEWVRKEAFTPLSHLFSKLERALSSIVLAGFLVNKFPFDYDVVSLLCNRQLDLFI